jgi:hypothetical protein
MFESTGNSLRVISGMAVNEDFFEAKLARYYTVIGFRFED